MITAPPKQKTSPIGALRDGRDEMNLVEFPFATLSDRAGGRNVLEFQVETYDRVLGRPVVRKLTVTGDAKFGLPTAKDEEVYLGMLQLTKLRSSFTESRVYFTRSELIRLMGWKNRDWAYHRIATSLRRLTGVRLFYENAWRDNAKKQYRTVGGFGLLDSFHLRDGRIRPADKDQTERLSEFRWNSVIFESFQAGYVKRLDYQKVRQLGALARRIYRYLDKHFHPPQRTTIVLNLTRFAFEHIGISRNSDNAQIRRALSKPVAELEAIGFIDPNRRRFQRISGQRGQWEISFTLGGCSRKAERISQRVNGAATVTPRANRRDRLDHYLDLLPPKERTKLEQEAMQGASGFLLETLQANNRNGPLAEECRRQIVRAFIKTSKEQQGRRGS